MNIFKINIFTALFLLLLALKLIGIISVSWWWVFSPLLVVAVLFTVLFVIPTIIIWRNK